MLIWNITYLLSATDVEELTPFAAAFAATAVNAAFIAPNIIFPTK
jgi:hypothetical protein